MNHIYWLGIRKSDLLSLGSLYNGSITLFGDGENGNIALFKTGISRQNHNIDLPIFAEFNKMAMLQIINQDSEAKFMFYNPILAYSLEENLRKRVICLNSLDILKIIDDKMLCKLWLKNDVQLLENVQMFGSEINMKRLNNMLGDKKEYILQLPISSGGTGTYIFNKQNCEKVMSKLNLTKLYTVSPYYKKAIPLNIHCVICENTFQLYPISVQIIREEKDNLIYKGCDFISAQTLDCAVREQLKFQAVNICKKLCQSNYRGVCGIDFMLIDNNIYFCEINPRFQASTMTLNRALIENHFMSIHESTLRAFSGDYQPDIQISETNVSYSSYAYEENNEYDEFHKNMYRIYFSMHPEYNILKDGYTFDSDTDQGAYLFRTIFPHPLVDICSEEIRVNELFSGYVLKNPVDLIHLKIMLINFGVRISREALVYIQERGNLREANFSAIDIILGDKLVVNCPYKINYTEYSPFSIQMEAQHLTLYYHQKKLTDIAIYYESPLNRKKTTTGVPYYAVAFLAVDRLRINYNPVCYYKMKQSSCQFCNLPDNNFSYEFNDISEIIEDYLEHENFRHILLGGGSSNPTSDFSKVIKITQLLKRKTDKPLYLMSLPPQNLEIIEQLYNAGISEIAFNIEIFDPELAKHYMTGKGKIPREHYYDALRQAVLLWGKNGNVRSMIVLGLEPEESLLTGIEMLCKIGVQPMLSIFRPMENTPLSTRLPLSTQKTLELYEKIRNICINYGQSLGPTCVYCQNNTLSIPNCEEAHYIYMQ